MKCESSLIKPCVCAELRENKCQPQKYLVEGVKALISALKTWLRREVKPLCIYLYPSLTQMFCFWFISALCETYKQIKQEVNPNSVWATFPLDLSVFLVNGAKQRGSGSHPAKSPDQGAEQGDPSPGGGAGGTAHLRRRWWWWFTFLPCVMHSVGYINGDGKWHHTNRGRAFMFGAELFRWQVMKIMRRLRLSIWAVRHRIHL